MFLYIFLISLLSSASALASTGETYGYGSQAAALGNTMLGGSRGGFATFYNPGANSAHEGLNVDFALVYAKHNFHGIKNVVVSNSATSSSTTTTRGDIDTDDYLDHLSQALGVSYNLGEKFKHLSLGLVGSLPIARVAYLDTGEPFKPEYFNYRSRTQRPQIYASLSVSPTKWLHMGTGIAIATNLSATTTLFVSSTASQSASYQRFSSTIKPTAAPYFALYLDPKPWELGLAVRLPNKSTISIDMNANARILAGTGDIPLVANSTSTIFYDPLELNAAISRELTESLWGTVELDWFQYKAFESPAITVTGREEGIRMAASIDNKPNMRNIFVPKVGLEKRLEATKLRAGYFYRQSPVIDNLGAGNLVDPSKHVISAGIGFDLQKLDVTKYPVVLDLHAQYHRLLTQRVTKSGGNEKGDLSQSKVGSPGFDIGGNIYSAGLSLSMSL